MLRIDINLIFTVINVLILVVAVRVFLWKPIHKIIAQRQEMVENDLNDAAKAKAEAEANVEEQNALKADIEKAKAAAIAQAEEKGRKESAQIVEDAKVRAEGIVKDAEALALKRQEAILKETQKEITEIVVSATAKVEGVATKDQKDLYDEFLEKAGNK